MHDLRRETKVEFYTEHKQLILKGKWHGYCEIEQRKSSSAIKMAISAFNIKPLSYVSRILHDSEVDKNINIKSLTNHTRKLINFRRF